MVPRCSLLEVPQRRRGAGDGPVEYLLLDKGSGDSTLVLLEGCVSFVAEVGSSCPIFGCGVIACVHGMFAALLFHLELLVMRYVGVTVNVLHFLCGRYYRCCSHSVLLSVDQIDMMLAREVLFS